MNEPQATESQVESPATAPAAASPTTTAATTETTGDQENAPELEADGTKTSPPNDPLRLVVVGDSIPFAAFCAGCEGFVDQYAAWLEVETGRAVEAVNRSRNDAADLSDINYQLVENASLREQLRMASVVIVSVGFNDQAPWPKDRPCQDDGGFTLATKVAAILQYSDSCIAETIESYRPAYQSVFDEISALVPEPRVLMALNVYNIVPGFPDLEGVGSKEELDSLTTVFARILDQWNEMLCETATSHDFSCVDIYAAFNGTEGINPPGSRLESDYTHPSQAGNDLIADLLQEIDVTSLSGSS